MTIIPFFSAIEVNKIDDYVRYRNLKLYIQSKSSQHVTSKELMALTGYAKFDKFRMHQFEFDYCYRDIPLEYLKAINADINTLKFCLELDKQEFDKAIKLTVLYPKFASIRLMSAIYNTKSFPEGTIESEAIKILQDFCKQTNKKCMINFPDLKTIMISEHGEKVETICYPPYYKFTKSWLMLKKNGIDMGVSYIK
ncbi:MAG: hypothetical protein GW938_15075 [Leptospira sp.]|nr:hypothetical protein [Leptospira sp.]NCS94781.1 hypothetical protein [Leptospira sp.]